VAIGAVSWLDIARIVRGQTLSLRNKEFIEAARASGVRGPAIVVRHLVPNLLGIVMIYATLTVPSVILFRGISQLSWPRRASADDFPGRAGFRRRERIAILSLSAVHPGLFLALIVYCLNYLGDGLRDVLDPKER
jgi:oligopeptide transport system permease protein